MCPYKIHGYYFRSLVEPFRSSMQHLSLPLIWILVGKFMIFWSIWRKMFGFSHDFHTRSIDCTHRVLIAHTEYWLLVHLVYGHAEILWFGLLLKWYNFFSGDMYCFGHLIVACYSPLLSKRGIIKLLMSVCVSVCVSVCASGVRSQRWLDGSFWNSYMTLHIWYSFVSQADARRF